MNIRTKDLNLLAVFVVISEELNLSRAAERLQLSQPALSHALARLRRQFGDPLFVRGRRGLIATRNVSLLMPGVRALLAMASKVYGEQEALDLTTVERRVVIACTAYFEGRIIGDFIKTVQAAAPGLRIETRSLSSGFPKQELESGEIDLAIAAYFSDLPNGFRVKTVFRDRFVIVCSSKHPYLKTKLSVADYLNCRHMQIEVPPGVVAPVDRYFEGKSRKRNIAIRIGNFFTPAIILSESDYLLTCPLGLADAYRELASLVICDLPFRLPAIETLMVWHEKDQNDSFHTWLRNAITAV